MSDFKEITVNDDIWFKRDEPIYDNVEIVKDIKELDGGQKNNKNDDLEITIEDPTSEEQNENNNLNENNEDEENINNKSIIKKTLNVNENNNINEIDLTQSEIKKENDKRKEDLSDLFENLSNVELEVDNEVVNQNQPYISEDILKQELFNEMISDLPTYKQTNPRIQQEIYERIDKIIEIVQMGHKLQKQVGFDEYPSLLDKYFNGNFTDQTIIPVVLDKKVVYRKIEIDKPPEFDLPEREYMTDSKMPSNTIIIKDEAKELQQITQLNKQLNNQEILYEQYHNTLNELIAPYVIDKEWQSNKPVGYTIKTNPGSLVFRYQNWETTMWEYRQTLDNEKVNLIGFLILNNEPDQTSTTLIDYISINKIESKGKNTIITTSANHELEKDDEITLINTPIDLYLKRDTGVPMTFTIIATTNNTITISFNSSEMILPDFKENMGQIYAKKKLILKTIKWTHNRKSSINLSELPLLILIEPINMLSDTYEQLLKQTIPTLETLLGYYQKNMNNIMSISELPKLLEWNELNSTTAHLIKEFMKTNIDKYSPKSEYEVNKNKNEKENKMPDFLKDEWFYNKEIKEVYEMPEYDLTTAISRINFLLNQPDHGDYYYTWLFKKQKISSKSIIEKLENVNKEIEKETKLDKDFISTCSTVIGKFNTYKELVKKTISEDKNEIKIVIGSRALVLSPPTLYEFVNNDEKWKKVDTPTTSLEQLCFFASVKDFEDISKLNFDTMRCQLLSDEDDIKNTCTSQQLSNLLYQRSILESQVPMYELRNNYKSLTYLKEIIKYYENKKRQNDLLEDITRENEELQVEKILGMKNTDKLAVTILELLTKISLVGSYKERRYLIYRLIERDGILINNMVYSRKYGSRMICGHWYFLKLISDAPDNVRRESLTNTMLNRFGDGGNATMGSQICRICGQYLDRVKFSEHDGFDDQGHLKRERTIIPDAIGSIQDVDADTRITEFQLFCDGIEFKEMLSRLKIEQSGSSDICKYMHTLTLKLNLLIWKSHFMEIYVDVTEKYRKIPSKDLFIKLEKDKLKKQQIDDKKIQYLETKGFFTTKYEEDIKSLKWIYFATRFLILLQTSVPPYHITRPNTSCVLEGIDGEKGINYMVCLLEEIKVINQKVKTKFTETFNKILDEWRTMDSIIFKYDVRKQYDEIREKQIAEEEVELQKRLDLYKTGVPTLEYIEMEDETAPNKKQKKIQKTLNIIEQAHSVNKRFVYLTLSLMDLVHRTVLTQLDEVVNPLKMENTCCYELNEQFGKNGYYGWFGEDALDMVNELQKLSYVIKRRFGFMNKGAFRRHQLPPNQLSTQTDNQIPYEITLPADKELVLAKFLIYCSVGEYKGTPHDFITDDSSCVKCGLTKQQIKDKQYTIQDFNNLLNEIRKRTLESLDIKKLYVTEPINKLMTNVPSPIPPLFELETLLNQLFTITLRRVYVKADKSLIDKYVNIILTTGENNKYYDVEINKIKNSGVSNNNVSNDELNNELSDAMIERMITKLKDLQKQSRLDALKKLINDYLRKDISMIKNRKDLSVKYNIKRTMFGPNQGLLVKDREELQDISYVEMSGLEKYIKEKKSFMDLDFSISATDINNIVADSENIDNTINAMMYWLIGELNGMLERGGKVFAEFLLYELDKYDEDMSWHNMSPNTVNIISKTITTQETYREEQLQDKEEIRKILGRETVDLEIEAEETGINPELEQNNLREDIDITIKKKYMEQYDREPTEDELEGLRDDYMREMKYETDVVDVDYDLEEPHEGLEIVQIGEHYGEIAEGDMERAGDGLSDFSETVLDYHGVD